MSPPSTSENYPSSGSQTIISDGPAVDMRDVELGQRWCVLELLTGDRAVDESSGNAGAGRAANITRHRG